VEYFLYSINFTDFVVAFSIIENEVQYNLSMNEGLWSSKYVKILKIPQNSGSDLFGLNVSMKTS